MQRPVKSQRMPFCQQAKHRMCVGARLGLDVDVTCNCKCHTVKPPHKH